MITPQSHRPLSRLKLSLISLVIASYSLTACSTISVGKRSTPEAILDQRVTVLTGNRLSEDTRTRLLQAGLDEPTGLANLPACLVALRQASFISNDKGLYGAYSELFYASALQYRASKDCAPDNQPHTEFSKKLITMPATSLTDKTPNSAKLLTTKPLTCTGVYNDNLLQASRFAYIYLMYDKLQKDTDNPLLTLTLPDIGISAFTPKLGNLPKERDIQIQDLYYASIDALGSSLFEKKLTDTFTVNDNTIHVQYNRQLPSEQPDGAQTRLQDNANPHGTIPKTPDLTRNPSAKIANLISSYQLNLSGLNSISRRDGMGINYVAVMDDRYTTSIRDLVLNKNRNNLPLEQRIHPLGHLPVTVVLSPKGNSLAAVLNTNEFDLQVFDPYHYKTVNLLGTDFPLGANFSAPYALWLKDNALGSISIINLLARNSQITQPQLFMLEPYSPNKRVIIMLHGLASSPETWIQLTNDIFNDPALRDNYQVWQIFYPTNIPMLENRYEIQKLINATFDQVDANHQDKASSHAVLVGHSMGGILGRLMLSNDNLNPKLKTMLNDYDVSHAGSMPMSYRRMVQHFASNDLDQRFQLNALPEVDRAIFISSPFRGTNYADKWFTRALRRVIQLPKGFVTTVSTNLQSIVSEGELSQNPLGGLFLENGASQLSDKSFFMQLTKDIKIADNVKYHTIIASKDKDILEGMTELEKNQSHVAVNPLDKEGVATPQAIANTAIYNTQNVDKAIELAQAQAQRNQQITPDIASRISDGIVPYASAHLDNALSEKVLTGNHSVQASPQAVLELRRILHEQLQQLDTSNPALKDRQP